MLSVGVVTSHKAGANPNVSNPQDGSTPLHEAARANNIEGVKVLLEFGADHTRKSRSDRRARAVVVDSCRSGGNIPVSLTTSDEIKEIFQNHTQPEKLPAVSQLIRVTPAEMKAMEAENEADDDSDDEDVEDARKRPKTSSKKKPTKKSALKPNKAKPKAKSSAKKSKAAAKPWKKGQLSAELVDSSDDDGAIDPDNMFPASSSDDSDDAPLIRPRGGSSGKGSVKRKIEPEPFTSESEESSPPPSPPPKPKAKAKKKPAAKRAKKTSPKKVNVTLKSLVH